METKKIIGGLLAGAAIGVAIGILLAPESGDQTRKKIIKKSKDLADNFKATFEDHIGSLKNQYNEGVDELAKRGKDLISSVNDRIKS